MIYYLACLLIGTAVGALWLRALYIRQIRLLEGELRYQVDTVQLLRQALEEGA